MHTGQRREGSFSAVFSWTFKASNALTAGIGGAMVVWTGFDVSRGAEQAPNVLLHMKWFSIGVPLLFLVASWSQSASTI
ncbi:MAG: MFS transporter [Verrucomicrobiota bacterium]